MPVYIDNTILPIWYITIPVNNKLASINKLNLSDENSRLNFSVNILSLCINTVSSKREYKLLSIEEKSLENILLIIEKIRLIISVSDIVFVTACSSSNTDEAAKTRSSAAENLPAEDK